MDPRTTDLEARYRRYIGCLNDRRLDDLSEFVHEELTYNGRPMTRIEYQSLIASDVGAIPDLCYDVRLLVVSGDLIACRIMFDCTPQGEFLGLRVDGRRVSFAEHVFYRLREGKIHEVWSLIDRPAIEAQLAA